MRPYIFNFDNCFMITGIDENETDMFQVEESVLELKKTGSCQVGHADDEKQKSEDIVLEEIKLTVRINQGSEGKLPRVVKEKEENMLELMNNIVMYLRGIKYTGNWGQFNF